VTKQENQSSYQNRFWLKIMCDHMQFILVAISPNEKQEINTARSLYELFNAMLKKSREALDDDQLEQLNREAFPVVQEARRFQLHILKRQIQDHIELNLLPGTVNRLVSETEEYLNVLAALLKSDEFVIPTIRLHLLWLPDAQGHAGLIMNGVNMSCHDIRGTAYEYEKRFMILYTRAVEIAGLTRTGIMTFPAFHKFNLDTNEVLTGFTEFFVEIKSDLETKRILNTISPLWLDHMYREGCYYLTELSKVCNVKAPACDPSAPEIF
jgi:hypothetical protein